MRRNVLHYIGDMTESQGFWSYVHADDDAEGGRIVQLVHDIVAQYEMLTNETIELFLDRDDIAWGQEWKVRIEGSLASVAFFIPVLTPRYFASPICRGELNTFARRATDLGVGELLLPILYSDFPGLDDELPSDELIALVKRFQWVDWRDIKCSTRNSPEYRRAVAQLAQRLVEANRTAQRIAEESPVVADTVDEVAGAIELLAAMEEALPELTATTENIAAAVVEIGEVFTTAGEGFDVPNGAGSSFAKRLTLVRSLAAALKEPTGRVSELGENFASQLHDVDLGIRTMIERAPEEQESKQEFCDFFKSIRGMVESAETGLGALRGMIDSVAPLEKLSRDLRPPLGGMRHGLTLMLEGLDVMRAWVALMDSSGIECETAAEPPTLLE